MVKKSKNMETITKSPNQMTEEDFKKLKFSDYNEYYYFVNDVSSESTQTVMLLAGLLVKAKDRILCLNFDDFKRNFLKSSVPQTF